MLPTSHLPAVSRFVVVFSFSSFLGTEAHVVVDIHTPFRSIRGREEASIERGDRNAVRSLQKAERVRVVKTIIRCLGRRRRTVSRPSYDPTSSRSGRHKSGQGSSRGGTSEGDQRFGFWPANETIILPLRRLLSFVGTRNPASMNNLDIQIPDRSRAKRKKPSPASAACGIFFLGHMYLGTSGAIGSVLAHSACVGAQPALLLRRAEAMHRPRSLSNDNR